MRAYEEEQEYCVNCKYYTETDDQYFTCDNPDSDGYALETLSTDWCEEYKAKYDMEEE